jgi:hypothetical protein
MGALPSQIASLPGGSGAFWEKPKGKAVLAFTMPAPGDYPQGTGIVLAPTPGQWCMYQWRWEVLESEQGYQLAARVYSGFIAFSSVGGNADARFGTGQGDPGYSANANPTDAQSFNYNLPNTNVGLLQNNSPNHPIFIVSGEVVLQVTHGGSAPAFAKGVFTLGPEVILPGPPV